MNRQPGFFDFAAEVGLTKHIGGLEATEALIGLCHIEAAGEAPSMKAMRPARGSHARVHSRTTTTGT